MRRREFIAGLGGTAWTVVARAQEPGKVFRLGYLDFEPRTDPTNQNLLNSFMPGLRKLGYAEERNLRVEE